MKIGILPYELRHEKNLAAIRYVALHGLRRMQILENP
jgi:hypothetical protein